jgi:hypothetical protein
MFRCPECGEPLTVPRSAWFGPGERVATCPHGHVAVVSSEFSPAEDGPEFLHQFPDPGEGLAGRVTLTARLREAVLKFRHLRA